MTKSNEQNEQLAEIGRLLDAYGADESRWPAAQRGRLAAAGRDNPAETGRLVGEARAVDALLAAVPAPHRSLSAEQRLADRIVAAVLAAGPAMDAAQKAVVAAKPPGEVISLETARRSRAAGIAARLSARGNRWRNVAALMAASMLFGIILGGSLRLDPLLEDMAEAVGLPSGLGVATAALLDETGDEDAL